jgi:serine/threonine protein kinase
MLQNPKVAFRDPALQQSTVEKDARNQPKPWSGAFAVVYKGTAADGSRSFAVRCFTTESPERRERYDQISAYLKTRQLDCLVDFEYRDRSIRSAGDGKWYPVILMDWVQGDTLFKWARARSLEGNQGALAVAAERWVGLVKELADAHIAHGDLQHANIMVTTSGELKLVDYDCMCVPALVGRRNLEVGVEPYQHPDRNETTHLCLDLDNFSALVIYVALRALAADPRLWQKYIEKPEYDKLLFRLEDFRSPTDSPLYHDLRKSPAQDVPELTEQLVALWRARMDQVPPLAYLTNSYAKVEQLLANQQWEEAVKLLNRRGQFRDAPKHLQALIHQAYEHVCRKEAWQTFTRLPKQHSELNDRKLVNAWNESLFAGYEPAELQRSRIRAARKHVQVLDRLHHLVQQSAGAPQLAREQAIVNVAEHLPQGYQYSLRPRVARAEAALEAVRRLAKAIRKTDADDEIVAAWRQVVQANCQGLVDPKHRPRIQLAEKRLPILTALRALSEDLPPDQLDRRLLDLWREDLLRGLKEAERWRAALETARHRRQLLERLEEAIRRSDEPSIVRTLADPVMAGYPVPVSWHPAIQNARGSVAKTETLQRALQEGDRSRFLDLFDVRVIRRYPERFEPFRTQLGRWTETEVLPAENMGLRGAIARASVVLVGKAHETYRIRWTWPQQRFTDECILAICPDLPAADEDPREFAASFREPIDRTRWESGGGSWLLHAERAWQGQHVVVWAVVDLGFQLMFSHPLALGTLGDPEAGAGRGWKVWPFSASGRSEPASARDDPTPTAPPPERPDASQSAHYDGSSEDRG